MCFIGVCHVIPGESAWQTNFKISSSFSLKAFKCYILEVKAHRKGLRKKCFGWFLVILPRLADCKNHSQCLEFSWSSWWLSRNWLFDQLRTLKLGCYVSFHLKWWSLIVYPQTESCCIPWSSLQYCTRHRFQISNCKGLTWWTWDGAALFIFGNCFLKFEIHGLNYCQLNLKSRISKAPSCCQTPS